MHVERETTVFAPSRCGAVTIFSLKQVPPNTLNLNPLGDKYKKVRQEGRLWAVEWAFPSQISEGGIRAFEKIAKNAGL